MGNRTVALLGTLVLAACGGDAPADPDAAPIEDFDAAPAPDAEVCSADEPIVVFLNFDGGDYVAGKADDSSTNTSLIVDADVTIPAYAGTADLDAVATCVAGHFAPFNVTITTTDPGAAIHREVVFLDNPTTIGLSNGTSGVSPFTCPTAGEDIMPIAIGFMFPDQLGEDTTALCEITAQIIGNTFALDHSFHCPDLMTYQSGCGTKSFVDMDVPCGEFEARNCTCGGRPTQNSYRRIADVAGLACD